MYTYTYRHAHSLCDQVSKGFTNAIHVQRSSKSSFNNLAQITFFLYSIKQFNSLEVSDHIIRKINPILCRIMQKMFHVNHFLNGIIGSSLSSGLEVFSIRIVSVSWMIYNCKKFLGSKLNMNKSLQSSKEHSMRKRQRQKRNFQKVILRHNGGVNTRSDYSLQPSYLVSFLFFNDIIGVCGFIPVNFFSPFHAEVSLTHCTKHG